MDKLDPERRSANMARVRGKDTAPELRVRRIAHRIGLRFRLHRKDLPGRPDLVLPKYRLAVFVHGCFWHRHPGCSRASTPATRPEFWQAKFEGNVARDRRQKEALEALGWTVLILWECELKEDGLIEARLREVTGGSARFQRICGGDGGTSRTGAVTSKAEAAVARHTSGAASPNRKDGAAVGNGGR